MSLTCWLALAWRNRNNNEEHTKNKSVKRFIAIAGVSLYETPRIYEVNVDFTRFYRCIDDMGASQVANCDS